MFHNHTICVLDDMRIFPTQTPKCVNEGKFNMSINQKFKPTIFAGDNDRDANNSYKYSRNHQFIIFNTFK